MLIFRFYFLFFIFFSQTPILAGMTGKGYSVFYHILFSLTFLPVAIGGLRHVLYATECDDEYITATWLFGPKRLKIDDIRFFSIGGTSMNGYDESLDFRHGAYVCMKGKFMPFHLYHVSCSKELALALRLLKRDIPIRYNLGEEFADFANVDQDKKTLERIKSQEL